MEVLFYNLSLNCISLVSRFVDPLPQTLETELPAQLHTWLIPLDCSLTTAHSWSTSFCTASHVLAGRRRIKAALPMMSDLQV